MITVPEKLSDSISSFSLPFVSLEERFLGLLLASPKTIFALVFFTGLFFGNTFCAGGGIAGGIAIGCLVGGILLSSDVESVPPVK